MTEIYPNLPVTFKKQAAFIIDLSLRQSNPVKAIQMIKNFSDTCTTAEEKDFIQFYLDLKKLEVEPEDESITD